MVTLANPAFSPDAIEAKSTISMRISNQFRCSGMFPPLSEILPAQQVISFLIFLACLADDLFRQYGSGRLLVPIECLQIVANVLLVKRKLRSSGKVSDSRPVAGRIRSQHLIGENQFVTNETELELGVGEKQPLLLGKLGAALVNSQRQIAQPRGELAAYLPGHKLEADVLIMAGLRFDSGGENGLWQAIAFAQSRGN